jgi:hypothetical protein
VEIYWHMVFLIRMGGVGKKCHKRVKQPNEKKLSHRRLAAWIATAAATAVGSGDWLGGKIMEQTS